MASRPRSSPEYLPAPFTRLSVLRPAGHGPPYTGSMIASHRSRRAPMSLLLAGLLGALLAVTAACEPAPSPAATVTPQSAATRTPTPTGTQPSSLAPTVTATVFTALATPAASPTPANAPASTPSTTQEVTAIFFDVGESGDGFLISTWDGHHMLVDGGRRNSGMASMLAALGVTRLDIMVATNPDADHIGGLIDVLKSIPVSRVVLSGDINTTITFEDFMDAAEASGAEAQAVRRGDVLRLGSVPIEVLHPREQLYPDRNNTSVVLRVQHGVVSFLLAGDIESAAENDLVRSGVNLRSTILKLAHHGSRTSTSPGFLAAIQPEVAVYQAGAGNRYGHPHAETMARLRQAQVAVYGTAANGVVIVTTDGTKYSVETER